MDNALQDVVCDVQFVGYETQLRITDQFVD